MESLTPPAPRRPDGTPSRCAVVDDDPLFCEIIAADLEEAGFGVRTFLGGDAFLAALDATAPDCVILDYYLKNENGLDVCQRLREVSTVPVIMLTAAGEVVDRVVKRIQAMAAKGETITGQPIRDVVTVNGVRVTAADGTWGLVRASSNKPELVVVVESPVSEARMREMFKAVDTILRENPEVGAYNQTI